MRAVAVARPASRRVGASPGPAAAARGRRPLRRGRDAPGAALPSLQRAGVRSSVAAAIKRRRPRHSSYHGQLRPALLLQVGTSSQRVVPVPAAWAARAAREAEGGLRALTWPGFGRPAIVGAGSVWGACRAASRLPRGCMPVLLGLVPVSSLYTKVVGPTAWGPVIWEPGLSAAFDITLISRPKSLCRDPIPVPHPAWAHLTSLPLRLHTRLFKHQRPLELRLQGP